MGQEGCSQQASPERCSSLSVQCSLSITDSIIPEDRKFWQSIMRMTDITGLTSVQEEVSEGGTISKETHFHYLKNKILWKLNTTRLFLGCRYLQHTGIMSTSVCIGELSLCLYHGKFNFSVLHPMLASRIDKWMRKSLMRNTDQYVLWRHSDGSC